MAEIQIHSKKSLGTFKYPKPLEELAKSKGKGKGFFSFSFYLREESSASYIAESGYQQHQIKGGNIYLFGLLSYLEICRVDGAFKEWGCLVYTDQFSIDKLTYFSRSIEKILEDFEQSLEGKRMSETNKIPKRTELKKLNELVQRIFEFSNVHFVTVDFPDHERKRGEMVGTILRCMRHRAPFDFPEHMIFIRDLDTLFETSLKNIWKITVYNIPQSEENKEITDEDIDRLIKEREKEFIGNLHAWESNFLHSIPAMQEEKKSESLLVLLNYDVRKWHANTNINSGNDYKVPFGLCACFVNIIPPVKVFKTNLWDVYMDWLAPRNKKVGRTMSKLNIEYFKSGENTTIVKNLEKDPFYTVYPPPTNENLNSFINKKTARIQNTTRKSMALKYYKDKRNDTFDIFSNDADIRRLGRDEQYLIFLLAPRCLDELFFCNIRLDGYMRDFSFPDFLKNHRESFAIFKNSVEKNFQGGMQMRMRKRKTRTGLKNKTKDIVG